MCRIFLDTNILIDWSDYFNYLVLDSRVNVSVQNCLGLIDFLSKRISQRRETVRLARRDKFWFTIRRKNSFWEERWIVGRMDWGGWISANDLKDGRACCLRKQFSAWVGRRCFVWIAWIWGVLASSFVLQVSAWDFLVWRGYRFLCSRSTLQVKLAHPYGCLPFLCVHLEWLDSLPAQTEETKTTLRQW